MFVLPSPRTLTSALRSLCFHHSPICISNRCKAHSHTQLRALAHTQKSEASIVGGPVNELHSQLNKHSPCNLLLSWGTQVARARSRSRNAAAQWFIWNRMQFLEIKYLLCCVGRELTGITVETVRIARDTHTHTHSHIIEQGGGQNQHTRTHTRTHRIFI